MSSTFSILPFAEEQKLSNSEYITYLNHLREYLLSTNHEGLSSGSLTICPKINPFVSNMLTRFCGYELDIKYSCDIKGIDAIYAFTHQSKMDHVNFIASNPNHTILLNSVVLSNYYKNILKINGVYFVDKRNKQSMNNAKLEMIRLLLNDRSITLFPESAWNLSPNKLILPIRYGVVDIAKKSKKPIIPAVIKYYYDEGKLDGKERIKVVKIRYGEPIFVHENDSLTEKMNQYIDWVSTTKWNLMEENGFVQRNSIDNQTYTNFLKASYKNLRDAGIDVDVERSGIFGANDDFYLFNHINDVPFSDDCKLLQTVYCRKLENIFQLYLKNSNPG